LFFDQREILVVIVATKSSPEIRGNTKFSNISIKHETVGTKQQMNNNTHNTNATEVILDAILELHTTPQRWEADDFRNMGFVGRAGLPHVVKMPDDRRKAILLKMKGKFECSACNRTWSSAKSYILIRVTESKGTFHIGARVLEQDCRTCSLNTFPSLYDDEAERIANFIANAYELRQFPERTQRSSSMRSKHDRRRCGACRLGVCGK
jgi:hypothetical protein